MIDDNDQPVPEDAEATEEPDTYGEMRQQVDALSVLLRAGIGVTCTLAPLRALLKTI